MSTNLETLQQQTITIRVVFDGAPHAGKTTAAHTLSKALGSDVNTPAEDDGRTVWFDWMAYSGGVHEGNAIRVELVTVPGQAHLDTRRRHLLAWGDVVVFIADTSAAAFEESATRFDTLRQDLKTLGKPVIIVANKRDLDDAVALDAVQTRLGIGRSDVLIESVATSGTGVQEAFIYAVRSALTSGPMRVEQSSADQLLGEMRAALLPPAIAQPATASPVAEPSVPVELDELPPPVAEPSVPVELDELPPPAAELSAPPALDELPPPPAPVDLDAPAAPVAAATVDEIAAVPVADMASSSLSLSAAMAKASDAAESKQAPTGDAAEVDHVACDVAEVEEVSTGDAVEVDHVACDVAEVEEVSTGDAAEIDLSLIHI